MPRPKVADDERLSEPVLVRFSKPDLRRLRRAAKAQGIKPATLVREGALASIEKQNR